MIQTVKLQRPALTRGQSLIVLLTFVACVIDGVDSQLLPLVSPVLLQEWNIAKSSLAPALSASIFGMAFGAWLGGRLGDRFGRKTILVLSVGLFGTGALLAGQCTNPMQLAVVRAASGLGFGAVTPNAFSLITEWLRPEQRVRAMGLMSVGIPMGGLVASGAALIFLPLLGWRGSFWATGVLALCIAAAYLVWGKESPAYLSDRGRFQEARSLISKVGGIGPIDLTAGEAEHNGRLERPSIFSRELLRLNIGASLFFFAISFASYSIFSWIPVVLTSAGYPLKIGLWGIFGYYGLAVIGALTAGRLIDRHGSGPLMRSFWAASFCAIAFIATMLFFRETFPVTVTGYAITGAISTLGAVNGVLLALIYSVMTFGYPTDRRAGGVGFGMMVGRLGGWLGVTLSGRALDAGGSDALFYFVMLLSALLLGLPATFVINRHIEKRS